MSCRSVTFHTTFPCFTPAPHIHTHHTISQSRTALHCKATPRHVTPYCNISTTPAPISVPEVRAGLVQTQPSRPPCRTCVTAGTVGQVYGTVRARVCGCTGCRVGVTARRVGVTVCRVGVTVCRIGATVAYLAGSGPHL